VIRGFYNSKGKTEAAVRGEALQANGLTKQWRELSHNPISYKLGTSLPVRAARRQVGLRRDKTIQF